VAEGGQGVVAQVAYVLVDRGGAQQAGGEPVGEENVSADRVEVGADGLVGLDAGGERGGLCFGGEALLSHPSGTAAGLAIAHGPRVAAAPPVRTATGLENAGHVVTGRR